MAAHSCIINAWSLSEFVGFCLFTCLLRIDHKFSMGLRPGEFPGNGPKISIFCFPNLLVITLPYGKVLHHAGKGIVCHQAVPGWLEEVAVGGCVGTILSLFMAVFLGKIVSEPTPLATLHMNGLRML
jgi:hypothetical protein